MDDLKTAQQREPGAEAPHREPRTAPGLAGDHVPHDRGAGDREAASRTSNGRSRSIAGPTTAIEVDMPVVTGGVGRAAARRPGDPGHARSPRSCSSSSTGSSPSRGRLVHLARGRARRGTRRGRAPDGTRRARASRSARPSRSRSSRWGTRSTASPGSIRPASSSAPSRARSASPTRSRRSSRSGPRWTSRRCSTSS